MHSDTRQATPRLPAGTLEPSVSPLELRVGDVKNGRTGKMALMGAVDRAEVSSPADPI
jgi:hypothetical protein